MNPSLALCSEWTAEESGRLEKVKSQNVDVVDDNTTGVNRRSKVKAVDKDDPRPSRSVAELIPASATTTHDVQPDTSIGKIHVSERIIVASLLNYRAR